MNKEIFVYEDWRQDKPALVGMLFVDINNGKEVFSFEYDKQWLYKNINLRYDPDLQIFTRK